MRNVIVSLLILASTVTATCSNAQETWTEGKEYFVIQPPQHTDVAPGKVEVRQVFSFACPACNQFRPIMRQIIDSLPENAEMAYTPASFNPSEDWPMFQRAYYAAKALGIEEQTHEAMYDAIWGAGAPLAIVDSNNRLKRNMPTIEDAAKFYARETDVTEKDFLDAANSFSVNLKMSAADEYIKVTQTPSTPTLIVNGKYRLNLQALATVDRIIDLIKYLVAKESAN